MQLQALVNIFGFHDKNEFCAVAYEGTGGLQAEIYWPTQNKLIQWIPDGTRAVLNSFYYRDLTRDVAATDHDIPSDDPNPRLTRTDADEMLQDCAAFGNIYTVKKTAGGWVSIQKLRVFSRMRADFSLVNMQLQDLVDNNGNRKENNFCVVGQKDGPFLGAYVYWETTDQLIFWYPEPYELGALTYSEVQIDLRHGLRDEEDAADDRNEMQRSYAQSILQACRKSG